MLPEAFAFVPDPMVIVPPEALTMFSTSCRMRSRSRPRLFNTVAAIPAAVDSPAENYWPQWRGPYATGVSKTADPPVEWSETKNIRWKIEVPGRGSGTPVIWGDKVFVLSAVPVVDGGASSHEPRGGGAKVPHKFVVMALDRKTGKTVWERTAYEHTPHEGSHPQWGTWSSSSAMTDGEHDDSGVTTIDGITSLSFQAAKLDLFVRAKRAYSNSSFHGPPPGKNPGRKPTWRWSIPTGSHQLRVNFPISPCLPCYTQVVS